jgi:molecular chaperone DnaJ
MAADFEILGLSEGATSQEVRRAYRALARRWHPDRFPAGPERDWANDRMADINRAYRACIKRARRACSDDQERLERARKLIDDGQFVNARAVLMEVSTRRAEWNYLFGLMLMHRREYEKAQIYLSVAAHQMPNEPKYARMEGIARNIQLSKKRPIFTRFQR